MHLKAPAGAGKTFVALHMLRQLMLDHPDALVLFVARNVALCFFIVRWLARRLPNTLRRLMLLKRLFVLFEPFHEGARAVTVRHGRVEVVPTKPTAQFTLVVVDESHHIYSVPKLRDTVESYVTGDTRRVLVSDVSQSLGWGAHRHAAAAPVETHARTCSCPSCVHSHGRAPVWCPT